jgi:hypothetical protein
MNESKSMLRSQRHAVLALAPMAPTLILMYNKGRFLKYKKFHSFLLFQLKFTTNVIIKN